MYGSEDDDELWGQEGNDKIYGGTGEDVLHGGDGSDIVNGGDQNDYIWGEAGNDQLWGGPGDDVMSGGLGDDKLYGEAGNDTLIGNEGSNVLAGGVGDDTYYSSGAYDELWGGGGFDTYILKPTAVSGITKLIFEDVDGGLIDLSEYKAAGLKVELKKNSTDQLILFVSSGEQIVINGWATSKVSFKINGSTVTAAEVNQNISSSTTGKITLVDNAVSALSISPMSMRSALFAEGAATPSNAAIDVFMANSEIESVQNIFVKNANDFLMSHGSLDINNSAPVDESASPLKNVLSYFESNQLQRTANLSTEDATAIADAKYANLGFEFWKHNEDWTSVAVQDENALSSDTLFKVTDGDLPQLTLSTQDSLVKQELSPNKVNQSVDLRLSLLVS